MSSKRITITPDYNSMLEKVFILSKWVLKIVVMTKEVKQCGLGKPLGWTGFPV
jgi:hypothetical protein